MQQAGGEQGGQKMMLEDQDKLVEEIFARTRTRMESSHEEFSGPKHDEL